MSFRAVVLSLCVAIGLVAHAAEPVSKLYPFGDGNLAKIRKVRAHTKTLVSLGDCAVTSNVPAMRNPFGVQAVLNRGYVENVTEPRPVPASVIPTLLDHARQVHEVVMVDVFVPGCPPGPDLIFGILQDLVRLSVAEHFAAANDVAAIGDLQRLAHLVVGDQDRDAAGA